MRLDDPLLWTAAALAVAALALGTAWRRSRAALAVEVDRRRALEAAQRDALERTAAELATSARGLLADASSVTTVSAQAADSVRATSEAITQLTHGAMTAAVSADTVLGLALHSERTAAEALAALAEIEVALGAAAAAADAGGRGADVALVERTRGRIGALAAALRDSAAAARQVASTAQQQHSKLDEVLQSMNVIYLATERSLASTEQVAREARSLDELASSLRRAVAS